MTYVKALLFLLFFKVIVSWHNITANYKKVHLNKTKQNTLAILSQEKVIVGYQSGKIQIIDIQINKLNKSYFYFRNAVGSITVLDQKVVFVNDENKVLMLDHLGQVLRKWQGKQKNKGVIAAYNSTGTGYMSIIKKSVVEQRVFQNYTYTSKYLNFFDTGEHGANFATYSPLHTYLYIVNNRKNKILVYDISQITIFDTQGINEAINNTLIQNKTNNSSEDKKSTQNSYNQLSNREMQRRMFEVMNNNRKRIILERNFHFKIKKILADYKQAKLYNQALIIINSEDTVYYTNKATISTFLPYKNHTQDQLISICFCQRLYLLILHKHLSSDQTALFYLSFFNKKTLISQKVIQLNSIFPDLNQIRTMDCNHKRIAILTEQSELLIIENQYEEQKIEQIPNQEFITQIQLISTLIMVALFICCCRRRAEKSQNCQLEDFKSSCNKEQVDQTNEVLSKKKDQSQQKTRENSSQQQKIVKYKEKAKSNKDRLFHQKISSHKKNKKKLE